ncbi:hypothetical protein PR048_032354 [Dryococelus australis]|uniref:Uncharacterized protein n=1 Tax=Dryococelus australis TaxID=614101 RepID=A0ABQ9G200_9NEOP|nr:hypothetical protein PR048_032354 [Dryococelus australis]
MARVKGTTPAFAIFEENRNHEWPDPGFEPNASPKLNHHCAISLVGTLGARTERGEYGAAKECKGRYSAIPTRGYDALHWRPMSAELAWSGKYHHRTVVIVSKQHKDLACTVFTSCWMNARPETTCNHGSFKRSRLALVQNDPHVSPVPVIQRMLVATEVWNLTGVNVGHRQNRVVQLLEGCLEECDVAARLIDRKKRRREINSPLNARRFQAHVLRLGRELWERRDWENGAVVSAASLVPLLLGQRIHPPSAVWQIGRSRSCHITSGALWPHAAIALGSSRGGETVLWLHLRVSAAVLVNRESQFGYFLFSSPHKYVQLQAAEMSKTRIRANVSSRGFKKCSLYRERPIPIERGRAAASITDVSSVYGFSRVGISPGDGAGRRVFSGMPRFPQSYIPALLHTPLASSSSPPKPLRFTHFSTLRRLDVHNPKTTSCDAIIFGHTPGVLWPIEGLAGSRTLDTLAAPPMPGPLVALLAAIPSTASPLDLMVCPHFSPHHVC